MIVIRQETQNDYDEVYKLIAEAFATTEHADGNEQYLVVDLRKGDGFIPELSLVAKIDGELAGHILFTKAMVGIDEVVVLAPLSVTPNCQKQGVGTALIAEGHRIAKELGYQYSLVLGSELYYPKAGHIPAEQLGIEVPEDIQSENFMAIKLQEDAKAISGPVTYAKEFRL
ncbi:N-acetyltransferase [Enterococcus sp. 669A]|uniref:N-acetyltransferase n=1 Tax=Candidatus Enterococcus moelleringii TaxID=2815325 RepID=A0ABS3L910_9ENTE|nr:N-acetyltransferase [Enterococcus sp. 669A]MBO1305580.1 N-acetyltransferase [Enterococcus sp. 669A]